jgi:hypothetical protein
LLTGNNALRAIYFFVPFKPCFASKVMQNNAGKP